MKFILALLVFILAVDGSLIESLELAASPLRFRRAVVKDDDQKWNESEVVEYSVAKDISGYPIGKVFNFLEKKGCLKFKKVPKVEGNGIHFVKGPCSSITGKSEGNGTQEIQLNAQCKTFGGILPNVLMALGFYRTVERQDRDDYVTIDSDNIDNAHNASYEKQDEEHFGLPYDYGSILHPGPFQYAKNKSVRVITTKKKEFMKTIGEDKTASFEDIMEYNLLYKCADKCTKKPECKNGGIVNSNNCNACLCPKYFQGPLCGQLAKSSSKQCSGKNRQWKQLDKVNTVELNASKGPSSKNNEPATCIDTVTCPEGSNVELTILNVDADCVGRCSKGYIEVNLGNPQLTGFKVCCNDLKNQTFTTEKNRLILYSVSTQKQKPKMKYRGKCVSQKK